MDVAVTEAVDQIVEAIPIVVAATALCVIEYELGGDACFDHEDRQRTFYHGTNAYVAEIIVSEQRVDPVALEEEGSSASDFGFGFYMSEQLSTAQWYADWRGLRGRNGGPGIVRIEISNHNWRWLVNAGAIDSAAVSGKPGQTQAFVPIYLIDVFNGMKPRFSLAN